MNLSCQMSSPWWQNVLRYQWCSGRVFFSRFVSSLMCLKEKDKDGRKVNPTRSRRTWTVALQRSIVPKRWNKSAERFCATQQQEFLEESFFKCYNTRLIKTANIELSLSVFFYFSDNDCSGHYVDLLALVTTEERGSRSLCSSPSLSPLFNLWLPADGCEPTVVVFMFLLFPPHQLFLAQILEWWRGRLFSFGRIETRLAGGERSRSFICLTKDPVSAIRAEMFGESAQQHSKPGGASLSVFLPPLVDEGASSAPFCSAGLLLLHFSRPIKKCTLAQPWVPSEPWKLKVPQHKRTIGLLLHPCWPGSRHGNVVILCWRCLTGRCTLKHWKPLRIWPLILSANMSSCCCCRATFQNIILWPFYFN